MPGSRQQLIRRPRNRPLPRNQRLARLIQEYFERQARLHGREVVLDLSQNHPRRLLGVPSYQPTRSAGGNEAHATSSPVKSLAAASFVQVSYHQNHRPVLLRQPRQRRQHSANAPVAIAENAPFEKLGNWADHDQGRIGFLHNLIELPQVRREAQGLPYFTVLLVRDKDAIHVRAHRP